MHIVEEVKSRIPAVRLETERLRSGILEMAHEVPASGPRIQSADGKHTLHWKYSQFRKFRPYDDLEYETSFERRRIRCAVFNAGNDKVAAVDFKEYKLTEDTSDDDLYWTFDDCADHLGALATAFLSGWESGLLDYGNFAHLDHIAAKKGVGASVWGPLVSQFIDQVLFKSSFVVLADPYPHDVVCILNRTIDERLESAANPEDPHLCKEPAMEAFARRRHEAKWKFFSHHLGLTRYPEEAAAGSWMYKRRRDKRDIFDPTFRSAAELRF